MIEEMPTRFVIGEETKFWASLTEMIKLARPSDCGFDFYIGCMLYTL